MTSTVQTTNTQLFTTPPIVTTDHENRVDTMTQSIAHQAIRNATLQNIPNTIQNMPNALQNSRTSSTLFDAVRILIQQGSMNIAFQVAREIPQEPYKSSMLQDISRALIQSDNIDHALLVAREIPQEPYKSLTLQAVSRALIRNNDIDQALQIAWEIPRESDRSSILREISNALINKNIDQALQIAWEIPRESNHSAYALRDISHAFVQKGDMKQAFTVIDSIHNPSVKKDVISDICRNLVRPDSVENAPSEPLNNLTSKFKKALDIAELTPNEDLKMLVIQQIALALAQINDFEPAIIVAQKISNTDYADSRNKTLQDISLLLAKTKNPENFPRFVQVALLTPHTPFRDYPALRTLFHNLHKNGDDAPAQYIFQWLCDHPFKPSPQTVHAYLYWGEPLQRY